LPSTTLDWETDRASILTACTLVKEIDRSLVDLKWVNRRSVNSQQQCALGSLADAKQQQET